MGPQNELMPKARTAALRALELDESLAEAHASLALIKENYDYDWPGRGEGIPAGDSTRPAICDRAPVVCGVSFVARSIRGSVCRERAGAATGSVIADYCQRLRIDPVSLASI